MSKIIEPWQMTQEEYAIHYIRSREKAHEMYGKPVGKTLDIALAVEMAKDVHENIIKDALQKGFPVSPGVLKDYPELMLIEKEPWQMTAATYQRTNNWLQYGRYASLSTAKRGETALKQRHPFYETRLEKVSAYSDTHEVQYRLSHEQVVKNALATRKPVPMKVLQDYPDLIFAKMDVHSVSFNSHPFVCYGKQTRRGVRAYCRRKEK